MSPVQQQDAQFHISFRQYFEKLRDVRRTWFEYGDYDDGYGGEPWVIAVDESGNHAVALSPLKYVNRSNAKVLFANISQTYFDAGDAKTRDQLARVEMLRRCKLHIFWPRMIDWLGKEVLPPEK